MGHDPTRHDKPIQDKKITKERENMRKAKDKITTGLGPAGQWAWDNLSRVYDMSDPSVRLTVEVVSRAADRASEAAEEIRVNGINSLDRYNQCRPNPAVSTEDKARAAILSGLSALKKLHSKGDVDPELEKFIASVT